MYICVCSKHVTVSLSQSSRGKKHTKKKEKYMAIATTTKNIKNTNTFMQNADFPLITITLRNV